MKQENISKLPQVKLFGILGIAVLVLVGVIFVSSGMSGGKLLSQFSGTNITPATASSVWQPSAANPNRAKVAAYSTRLDAIIIRILARGSALTASGFTSYLGNLSDGIVAIGAKPEYAGDQDIKDVVAYLTYELSDAKNTLSMSGSFFSDITNLVEGTGGSVAPVSPGVVSVTPPASTGTQVNTITASTIDCPIGKVLLNGACTLTAGCQTWNGTTCMLSSSTPNITTACPVGFLLTNGACIANTSTPTVTTSTPTSPIQGTFLGCSRGGTSYIHGDVRCDGNQQVRCNDGSFIQIYSCGSGNICTENTERTSNNNFFASCVREYDTYRTGGGMNNITISETELAGLKNTAEYKCKYNATTKNYGNCVYQSCIVGQSHEEGGVCVADARECTLSNSSNGGRQTWVTGSEWSTCQVTTATACATGYRLINGACATGAATCNSSTISYGQEITTADGVETSDKTFFGYVGSGDNNWQYDTNLANACSWKCKEGYKKTSLITGYRGNQLCAVPDPIISLTSSKNTANPGDKITLNWTVSDYFDDGYLKNTLGEKVSGCHFTEPAELSNYVAGVGYKNPRGIVDSVEYTITKETVFKLDCRGSIRNSGSSQSITVKMAPPPTVGLSINSGGGTGGDFFALQWSTQNAISCTAGGPGATILGWTGQNKTSDVYQEQRFPSASIIDQLPGKKITLTCTGVGGTTTAETEFSKNSDKGSCVSGKFYKNGSLYPDPNTSFTEWLRSEYKKYGRQSIDIGTITKWTNDWKAKIVAGSYDSTVKSEISTSVQEELSGNWNVCSD